VTNDVEKWSKYSLHHARVLRLVGTENLYGYKEIDGFCKARRAASFARTISPLPIVNFDKDFASISLGIERSAERGCLSRTRVGPPMGSTYCERACFPYANLHECYSQSPRKSQACNNNFSLKNIPQPLSYT